MRDLNLLQFTGGPVLQAQVTTDSEGWTEDEIVLLRYYLLERTLEMLDGARKSHLQEELLSWVCDKSVHPFSFNICAQACGLDPDDLRFGILNMLEINRSRPSSH